MSRPRSGNPVERRGDAGQVRQVVRNELARPVSLDQRLSEESTRPSAPMHDTDCLCNNLSRERRHGTGERGWTDEGVRLDDIGGTAGTAGEIVDKDKPGSVLITARTISDTGAPRRNVRTGLVDVQGRFGEIVVHGVIVSRKGHEDIRLIDFVRVAGNAEISVVTMSRIQQVAGVSRVRPHKQQAYRAQRPWPDK